ncbi:unnamed protein product [Cercospora beticola]|nr:unnamed protein product [Cercospora beticola]
MASTGYPTFFEDKIVFLTGATGNLGSCTLHKLITQLRVRYVYAFVRGSKHQALDKLKRKLAHKATFITDSGKVQFIVGDIRLPSWGMRSDELRLLQNEVSIVVHTAANLSLFDPIAECMKNNCGPVLELARMAATFEKIQKFVFVSSVYVNSFLPDGLVREKLYPLEDSTGEEIDPELEHEEISRTGSSRFTKHFPWPYALSKYLAERLLLTRFSSLPMLIVRSSTIGPAFNTPYPLFGDEESYPIQHVGKIFMRNPDASNVWHAPANSSSGTNVLDELPVDWASNVLLLHIAKGTHGIVHASAGTYIKQTSNDALMNISHSGITGINKAIQWIAAESGPQCTLANLFVIGNRDWDFSCAKSASFKDIDGPLSTRVTQEQARAFNDRRYSALLEQIRSESMN